MTPHQSSGLRSTFAWERIEPGFIAVIDQDDGLLQFVSCSVTNDAENVIRYLARVAGLRDEDRVIYRDTQGRWDQLLHRDGKFGGYVLLAAGSKEEAIYRVETG